MIRTQESIVPQIEEILQGVAKQGPQSGLPQIGKGSVLRIGIGYAHEGSLVRFKHGNRLPAILFPQEGDPFFGYVHGELSERGGEIRYQDWTRTNARQVAQAVFKLRVHAVRWENSRTVGPYQPKELTLRHIRQSVAQEQQPLMVNGQPVPFFYG